MATPKFLQGKGDFHIELKKRVNQYFSDHKRSMTGNNALLFKAILFCIGYVLLYIHLVFLTPVVWLAIPECVLFGGLTAAIGFNVMHDGAHGSFSKFKVVNKIASFSLNFLGASAIMWNMKHNIIHHTYTNIDGIDDDIEASPWLRFAATQKKMRLHKFQHYYFWFLYTLLHLVWIFLSDYKKYFSRRIGPVALKKNDDKRTHFFLGRKAYLCFYVCCSAYNVAWICNMACWIFNYYNGYRFCNKYRISTGAHR